MNELISDVLRLDERRQAVFRVALAEQLRPLLECSPDYPYAVRAVDLCWLWIEYHDVKGEALYEAYCNDDDFGVVPAMLVASQKDRKMGQPYGHVANSWGCLVGALAYVTGCAFQAEGGPIPEDAKNDLPDERLAKMMSCYYAVVGPSDVPALLADLLKELPDTQLTRPIVSAKVAELAS